MSILGSIGKRQRAAGVPDLRGMSAFIYDPADFSPAPKTQLLILQPTPFCNIDCSYCYLPHRNSKARMSLSTIRAAAERLRDDGLAGDVLTVVWHAGEPLVLPPQYYEEAIVAIDEILGNAVEVTHSFQTNATLITEEWCNLAIKHKIRLGVSVDGPAELHDRYRKTRRGTGTHATVLAGMEMLRQHGIRFHAIAVVTDATLAKPDEFFDFFLEQGVEDIGCNFDEAEGPHASSSLSGNEKLHEAFLTRMLQRTIEAQGKVRVRELANAFSAIAQDPPSFKWHGLQWPKNTQIAPFAMISVACNGDFCTFSPELLGQKSTEFGDFILGNVNAGGYMAAAATEPFRKLWAEVFRGTKACEDACAYFRYCGGGAPANKFYENHDFKSTETLYCRTMFKRPFEVVLGRIEESHASTSLKDRQSAARRGFSHVG